MQNQRAKAAVKTTPTPGHAHLYDHTLFLPDQSETACYGPVLLQREHRVVELLITYEHFRLLHAGPTLVTASLAQRFCIIRGSRTIRARIHNCVTCKRVGVRVKPQLLGQLPAARLNPPRCFRKHRSRLRWSYIYIYRYQNWVRA